ncbi:MAG: hypothetical protein J5J00_12080 [Deltaproteobacteria bacterium]|nr:hypothetical protein [Deltaproteobacteria bacterium]
MATPSMKLAERIREHSKEECFQREFRTLIEKSAPDSVEFFHLVRAFNAVHQKYAQDLLPTVCNALEDGNPEVRRLALNLLLQKESLLHQEKSRAIACLHDPAEEVQKVAMQHLSFYLPSAHAELVRIIRQWLSGDDQQKAKFAKHCAVELSRTIRRLFYAKRPKDRREAALAAASLGELFEQPEELRRLLHDKDSSVVKAAVHAYASGCEARGDMVDSLLAVLSDSDDEVLREEIILTLGRERLLKALPVLKEIRRQNLSKQMAKSVKSAIRNIESRIKLEP